MFCFPSFLGDSHRLRQKSLDGSDDGGGEMFSEEGQRASRDVPEPPSISWATAKAVMLQPH